MGTKWAVLICPFARPAVYPKRKQDKTRSHLLFLSLGQLSRSQSPPPQSRSQSLLRLLLRRLKCLLNPKPTTPIDPPPPPPLPQSLIRLVALVLVSIPSSMASNRSALFGSSSVRLSSMFTATCRRLRIMKGSDAIGLGEILRSLW
ncbi:uncharacterized protein LOC109845399 [Asparagus officinalis]|uniref:uncharacterized protein LOC109845399 n=1 Tax=Asparagus officinalis TaxID=4686 RepID=UPI00098E6102|nr:uncharacterized protein LOC109845399 [Asparagus officinalis]